MGIVNLERHRERIKRLEARRDYLRTKEREEADLLEESLRALESHTEALRIVQAVAEEVQQQAHSQISLIVNRCLRLVFGPEAVVFDIEFEQKRGKTQARLRFLKGGQEVSPTGGSGVGVLDVASFGLRLASLVLSTPKRRKLLVLDEPFRCLQGHHQGVRKMLEILSEEFGVQIIMVASSKTLEVGKIIHIGGEGEDA